MKTTPWALPLFAAVFLLASASAALAQSDVAPPPPPPPPPPSEAAPPPPPAAPAAQPESHKSDILGYGSVNYQLSFPFGNTYQYTGVVSWRGLGLDLQWMVHPKIALGLLFAWNVFYVSTSQVINFRGVDVSGLQDRSLNVFPFLLDVRYMGGEKGETRPYAGLGIGGELITKRLELGLSAVQSTTFNFALAPELGLIYPFKGSDTALQLGARYNVAFAGGGLPIQNWLSLLIGIAWGSAL
jgi:hypothetical protein